MPVVLAVAAIAVAAGGAAYTGVAQADAADYQAKIAKENAKAAGFAAADAQTTGQIQQDQLRRQVAATAATANARFAASGIQLGSGTPSQVQEDIFGAGELDLLNSEHNTALAAWGYKNQQRSFIAEAGLENSRATNALIAGGINTGSSLLAGASQYNKTNYGLR